MTSRNINPEFSERLRAMDFDEEYIPFFDEKYFQGLAHGDVYGYDDYGRCKQIIDTWCKMVNIIFRPESVLDVGAAYGFVPAYFRRMGIPSEGIEPSPHARAMSKRFMKVDLFDGYLPNNMPDVGTFDVVTCTEVMEHMPADLAQDALTELASRANRYVVTLLMTGEWDEYQEDPSHINPRPREWWIERFENIEGFEVDYDMMERLDNHPYSKEMDWSGRFFVAKRA